MKHHVALAALLLASLAQAQNLVPNPSFEELNDCPHSYGELYKAVHWFKGGIGSPDLYNTCAGNDTTGVPANFFGYQLPATGMGYCGMWAYDLHEIIGVRLIQPLSIGETYWASIKVSWTTNPSDQNNEDKYATNKMGILCKMDSLIGESAWYPWVNHAQVYTNSIISDSLGWTTITGQFIADSAYRYLYVGNFFDDSLTQTIVADPNGNLFSYYYVDDICLSSASSDCLIEQVAQISAGSPVSAYFDPKARTFNVLGLPSGKDYCIELTDAVGKLLASYPIGHGVGDLVLDASSINPNMLVILRLRSEDGERCFKLLTSSP